MLSLESSTPKVSNQSRDCHVIQVVRCKVSHPDADLPSKVSGSLQAHAPRKNSAICHLNPSRRSASTSPRRRVSRPPKSRLRNSPVAVAWTSS